MNENQPASQRQDGWQPIDTAPTNDSVLVFIPNWDHYGPGIYRAILVDMGTGRRWTTTAWSCGRDLHRDYPATHWMPLPPPPGDEQPAPRCSFCGHVEHDGECLHMLVLNGQNVFCRCKHAGTPEPAPRDAAPCPVSADDIRADSGLIAGMLIVLRDLGQHFTEQDLKRMREAMDELDAIADWLEAREAR